MGEVFMSPLPNSFANLFETLLNLKLSDRFSDLFYLMQKYFCLLVKNIFVPVSIFFFLIQEKTLT